MFRHLSELVRIPRERGTVRAVKAVEEVLHYGLTFGFIFAEEDLEGARKWDVPLSKRLRAWRHGFTGKAWTILDLAERDPRQYVNDVDKIVRLPRANKPYQDVVSNKACFYAWFDALDDHLPTIYGAMVRGEFVPQDDAGEDVVELLDREGRLVVKPLHGHRGQGVHFLAADQVGYVLSSAEGTRRFDAPAGVRGALGDFSAHLVSAHVRQHRYAEEIYPHTTNTIRVLTLVDPDSGEPFVPRAMHRFGSEASRPLDSWSQGGVGAPVDVVKGTMRDVHHLRSGSGVSTRKTHPDTDARITGVEVPRWDEVRRTVLRFARRITGAPYLSWDVVVTGDGPVVIEANSPGDKDVVQLERGLFEEERCRRALDAYL